MLAFLAFLASPLGKWAGYGVVVLVLVATLLGVKYEWDQGRQAVKIVHAAKAVAATQVKAVQAVDKPAAAAEGAEQTKIILRTRTLIKKVPTYVSTSPAPARGCITWGMLRLHDAAVLGVDPASLQPPAGEPDDACSAVDPAAFMAGVASNYGAAEANAEQLNALEKDLNARAAAVRVPPAGPHS